MLRELKRNPHRITGFYLVNDDTHITIETEKGKRKKLGHLSSERAIVIVMDPLF